ncbi:HAD family hydrolase [Athalassotoga saccharophila]|uniref:HAD family hydrolase n=1 Tax=Athalassotoga saccharophila TaxID=1441386 RepID=UPI001379F7DA|nr:HAD family hydrolase [Athalassotoga saccharophila]BBJ28228.1 5-amino-6-(5-phospho-D-ribitylamino)uracil phosphatase YcsE [Athalassotoga saccharophila]
MIKFIGIDLDGTLLDSEKKISEKNLKAIEMAEKAGIKVTIFTGRSLIAAEEYLDAISSDIPGVFQNGAFISTIKSRKVIKKITLSHRCAREIISAAKKYDLFVILFTNFTETPDMIYDKEWPEDSNYTGYFERNAYRMVKVSDIANCVGEEVSEISIVGDFEKIKSMQKEIRCTDYTMILSTLFSNNNEAFVECFGPGCGKEKAFEFLIESLGVKRSDTAFIGDNYNDLEVLKITGYPVVMGNSYVPQELLKIAKYVTSSNDENGVAKAIEHMVRYSHHL